MEKELKEKLLEEGTMIFDRIFMKYDLLKKKPVAFEGNISLSASHIHIVEAIGKGYGNTVTALSTHFMITKGAVSQFISKLYTDGYIKKDKNDNNDKIIILSLSEKGWEAFNQYKRYNEKVLSDLLLLESKYDKKEFLTFLEILKDIDLYFDQFMIEKKEI